MRPLLLLVLSMLPLLVKMLSLRRYTQQGSLSVWLVAAVFSCQWPLLPLSPPPLLPLPLLGCCLHPDGHNLDGYND
jgi:hypothetical protein